MTEQERKQKIERAELLLEEYKFSVNQQYAESNSKYSVGEEVVYYGHKGTIVSIKHKYVGGKADYVRILYNIKTPSGKITEISEDMIKRKA